MYMDTLDQKKNTWINPKVVKLVGVGIGLNLVLSYGTALLNIPLYLDSVGTIVIASLCGGLPAVITAFLSTLLFSFGISLNLYYGIPAILFAWCSISFFKRHQPDSWKNGLKLALCLALIGALTSTVIDWYTFGEQINGLAAPLAFRIQEHGLSPFASQAVAELFLEIVDKLITVAAAWLILRSCRDQLKPVQETQRFGHSVRKRLSSITIFSVAAVGIFSILIGGLYYQKLLHTSSIYNAEYVSSRAALCVSGDLVEKQLAEGERAAGYAGTMDKLYELYENQTDIRYLYVYVIRQDGCYALFDLDVPGEQGKKAGTYIENDPDIYGRLDEFLAGGNVSPGYGNSPYGTIISAYTPVYDSTGKTVAYACADIDLSAYVQRLLTYVIQFATVVFGAILMTILLMDGYVNRHITEPIQIMVRQTRALSDISPENWLESEAWKSRIPIQTDDELEELYNTVSYAEKNTAVNIKKRIETEQELLRTREFEAMNKELEKMVKKADEANSAKTDFMSRMSHDMRTPMNAIIGLSALTLDDADKPEIVRDNMEKIRSSSDFLLGLVNDILDLAKIEDGSVVLKPEPYSYQDFLTNIRIMFQAQCDAKGLVLIIKKSPVNPRIMVDKLRLNQIFFNVLSNAVKYTPAGGQIVYSAEHRLLDDGRVAADFVIADTGIGMSEEYQKHLFEPFMQENGEVTPELQGSGLGLSITKQLVELMGGSIQIESKKNVGTTVRIHLEAECLEADVKVAAGKPAQEEDPSGQDVVLRGRRILLAEDHPLNAQIARKLLEKKEMQVIHAENGQAAVELFQASESGSFDAILMDIRMPKLSGLEATRAIRGLNREDAKTVPILAMSANAYPEDVQKSLDCGMNGHLAKPVDPERLYRTLAEQIRQSQMEA